MRRKEWGSEMYQARSTWRATGVVHIVSSQNGGEWTGLEQIGCLVIVKSTHAVGGVLVCVTA